MVEAEIPWEELLDDLFGSVLQELDSPHVAWVHGVCASWRSKVKKLLCCIDYHLSDSFPFQRLVEQFPALREVKIEFRGQHEELQQLSRMAALRQLKSLELCNNRDVLEFPHVDLSVLAACENLKHLTIEGCRFDAHTGIQQLSNLLKLSLLHCAMDVREPSLAQMLQGMAKLQMLRIECATGENRLNLRGISTLRQLDSLVLRVPQAANPDLARELSRMRQLKLLDVNITHCPSLATFDDNSLILLASLTNLKDLNLGGHCQLTDSGLEELSRLTGLTGLDVSLPSPLQFLAGQNVQGITDRGLHHLFPLVQLHSLNLSASKVSNRLLCLILQKLKHLRHLSLASCCHVSDTPLFHLDRCPHLTSLDISYCQQISDLGLFGISEKARRLRVLNMSGCHHLISDLGLQRLANLKLLSWLSLAFCEEVTDYGIDALLSGTPYITTLSLSGCYQISNKTVTAISSRLFYLKDLDLGHCDRITDTTLAHLMSLRCLQRVNLNSTSMSGASCQLLRGRGVTVHKQNRWWMN